VKNRSQCPLNAECPSSLQVVPSRYQLYKSYSSLNLGDIGPPTYGESMKWHRKRQRNPAMEVRMHPRRGESRFKVPFTALILTLLVLGALLTNSHVASLSSELIKRFGFAPRDLVTLQWVRVVTSVFLTAGGIDFWVALVLVAAFVGAAEMLWGTAAAALTFWAAHVLTVVVTFALSLPLHVSGVALWSLVYLTRDIGPSAGYVGCLGLAVAALSRTPPQRRLRVLLVVAIGTGLLAALVLEIGSRPIEGAEVSADIAHLVAFPTGLLAARLIQARRRAAGTTLSRERT